MYLSFNTEKKPATINSPRLNIFNTNMSKIIPSNS